ncbi:MAG: ATP-dependent RecD-like DNA helicase [Bacilli bacterium]
MEKYILGNIKKIIFESNNGPYKVGLFRVKETNEEDYEIYINKIVGFTGSFTDINYDSDYLFYGKMVEHPKYGIQFNVSTYEIKPPTDKESIILYLSSGMFRGIGIKTAKKIVEHFGTDTIDVIKNNYELLQTISGMTIEKARKMHDIIVNSDMNQDLILKLNSYGFSVKEAINLITKYKMDLMNIVSENIYELYPDISFDKLDTIFLMNHEDNHPYRIYALIKYNLYIMCYESGDTLIQKEELFLKMKKCFTTNFDSDIYLAYIAKLLDEKELVEIDNCLMLYDFYITEKDILMSINRINSIKQMTKEKDIDDYIKYYENKNKIDFDETQESAIKGALCNNFYIITGGPGTGKTTIIKTIVQILQDKDKLRKEDMVLLAPTGRSAKRMQESVGISAYTIHKFLKWNKETGTFQIDEYNKANEKVVIIDEASMIDIFLFSSLLKGLKMNVKLIMIGDANQLPSIGPGDILGDLLNQKNIKSKCLNTIYRVKEGSYISDIASDIKNQKKFDYIEDYSDFKFIESSDDNIQTYLTQICENIKKKKIPIENFQVLVPMYKGLNGIDNLNNLMAEIFNSNHKKYQIGDKYYRIKDKVIQLVNDIDNNVYNGDIGYIKDINIIDKKMIVDIEYSSGIVTYTNGDFDKFSLAYAISIHKAQGSEYDNVVVILAKSFMRMFYNKLIYTAVTRAKSSLIILGSLSSFNSSIQTLYANNRNTYMKHV